jgi:molybdopterin synthase catalytic subunit
MQVRVQKDDFDIADEVTRLTANEPQAGAVVTFQGIVRDNHPDDSLISMELEQYPGMTVKAIEEIADEAERRWPVLGGLIVHRYGRLEMGQNIVLVAVVASHRQPAFDAANFLIDWLKTRAPFWKKEIRESGDSWVEARATDNDAADGW